MYIFRKVVLKHQVNTVQTKTITENFFIKKMVNFILYESENWKFFKPEF